jgi:hypothetical protein
VNRLKSPVVGLESMKWGCGRHLLDDIAGMPRTAIAKGDYRETTTRS